MADAAFVTLQEAAERLGLKQRNLKRQILRAQRRAARVILHGEPSKGSVYSVNLNDLHELCPWLFPVRYDRAADELRTYLDETGATLNRLTFEISETADGAFALYGDVMDELQDLSGDVCLLRGENEELRRENEELRRENEERRQENEATRRDLEEIVALVKKLSGDGDLRRPEETHPCAMGEEDETSVPALTPVRPIGATSRPAPPVKGDRP